MEKPIVKLIKKHVYGNLLYYPGNELAQLFATLSGQTTITPRQIKEISKHFEIIFAWE